MCWNHNINQPWRTKNSSLDMHPFEFQGRRRCTISAPNGNDGRPSEIPTDNITTQKFSTHCQGPQNAQILTYLQIPTRRLPYCVHFRQVRWTRLIETDATGVTLKNILEAVQ